MPGRFFPLQHVELTQYGQPTTGLEVIGHLHPVRRAAERRGLLPVLRLGGNTLDYVYELEGDTLTILGWREGSPAYYTGTFSADGKSVSGDWVYPGGGGYSSTITRI